MSHSPILVTSATGKTGSRIVERLEAQGHSVRHGSRSATPPFDWHDRDTWGPALDGVKAAYIAYYPDLLAPGAPDDIQAFTQAAKEAGVEHLVLLSGRGEASAKRCEGIVRESGVSSTLVRASWYFQNFSEGMLRDSVLSGVLAMPAGEVREPFIDARDIADVAVAALTDAAHAGKIYELTGPRLMTFGQAAQELSAATGRQVDYVPVTLEQFHAGLEAETDTATADLVTALCREVFDGRNESLTSGVREALGREPRDFSDFVREVAAVAAWSA